jgi:hypothetical protein
VGFFIVRFQTAHWIVPLILSPIDRNKRGALI